MSEEKALEHLLPDERPVGERVLQLANRAIETDEPAASGFLDPAMREVAESVLASVEGVAWRTYGGHRQARRQRILVLPPQYPGEWIEPPVKAVWLRGDAGPLSADAAAEAILSAGIGDDELGDVLTVDDGAQAVIAAECAERLPDGRLEIGPNQYTLSIIDLERLAFPPHERKEIRATVASLRLDAVAAAGFGISRTKAAREIRSLRVKLNWRQIGDPAAVVQVGDIIAAPGRGLVRVAEVTGKTRKGRLGLLLIRER